MKALQAAGVNAEAHSASEPVTLHGYAGLVLTGGTDVDPGLYAQPRQAKTEEPDHERDAREASLLSEALAADLPVLAICRGAQLLNVHHGGSLTQHLTPPEKHVRRTPDASLPVHDVRIEPGTLLSQIAGAESFPVNSRHHQGIDRVGDGLRVSAASAEDGVVEAIERPDRRFVLGVQWHPEDMVSRADEQLRLFRAFGEAVGNPTHG
jgi:putative glutamine amidotransferase